MSRLYEADATKQIERFPRELLFPFQVTIRVDYVEHDLVVWIRKSNFPD